MGEQPEPKPVAPDANAAWSVVSILVSGMLFWGGIGWLFDNWLETTLFLPIFLILGAAGGLYLVVRRYGASDPLPTRPDGKTE